MSIFCYQNRGMREEQIPKCGDLPASLACDDELALAAHLFQALERDDPTTDSTFDQLNPLEKLIYVDGVKAVLEDRETVLRLLSR